MNPSYCPRCGNPMAEEEAFCIRCGSPRQAPVEAPFYPPPYQAYPPYPPPVVKKKSGLPASAVVLIVLVSLTLLGGAAFGVWHLFLKPEKPAPEGPSGSLFVTPSRTRPSSRTKATTQKESQESTSLPTSPPPSTTEPTTEAWPGPEMLDLFLNIIPDQHSGGTLQRWEKPIRIQLAGNVIDTDYSCLQPLIEDAKLLRLLPPIELVESDGNVFFYYIEKSRFPEVFSSLSGDNLEFDAYFGCLNDPWTKELTKMSVVINSQLAMDYGSEEDKLATRNGYTRSFFMRSLGVLGDRSQAFDSVLAQGNELKRLGITDIQLLTLLYDSRIQSGMTIEEAVGILTR